VKYDFLGSLVKILPPQCVESAFLEDYQWPLPGKILYLPAMKRSNRQFENREELREAKLSRSFHKMEKRNDTELKIAKLRH